MFAAPLKTTNTGETSFYLNYDAWDGYQAERKRIMGDLDRANVENFVALTGDMHTYVAAYLLEEYETVEQTARLPDEESRVGVEFMTPGVTSDNLAASEKLPPTLTEDAIETTVTSQNPHVEFFNSSRWGYTVVDVTRDDLTYTAYDVDRSVDSADAPRRLLRVYRVPDGRAELQELKRSPTDKLLSTVDGVGTGGTTDGPDVFADHAASGGDGL